MASRAVYNDTKIRVKASKLKPRTRYTIEVTDLSTGTSTTFSENSRKGTFTKTVKLKTTGVVRTVIRDSKGVIVKDNYTVSTAEIDCCIAKSVHDAINCTCRCLNTQKRQRLLKVVKQLRLPQLKPHLVQVVVELEGVLLLYL